jgi:hypothetical protein
MSGMDAAMLGELIDRSAMSATLAPSVHNTQPWRLALRDGVLEIHADPRRQLRVLDPTRRQLLISCGCALFNARATLAADGYDAIVERLPDPNQPDLIARLRLPESRSDWVPIGELAPMIERRHTNRREFEPGEVVSAKTIFELVDAAKAEDCELFVIADPRHRTATAALSQEADALQKGNPAYRAELRAWTSDDPQRRDGIPAMAVPHTDEGSGDDLPIRDDDVPIRDFDTTGMGWLPTRTQPTTSQCLLLLGTASDDPASWLRAGEALERIWLHATLEDYVASPLTQVIEVPRTRQRLRTELGLEMYPHILLRVGRASMTFASRRRDLEDMLLRPGDDCGRTG